MKKLLLFAFLLCASFAASQTTSTLASGGIGVSCNAVTASTSINPGLAGGCTSFNLLTSGGTLPVVYTWQTITTGSPASVTVNLMGSLDNTTWIQLDTMSSATTQTVTSTAYRFLGCVPTVLSGGSSPKVTCQISVSSGTAGGSGSGTVNTGTATHLAIYPSSSASVSSDATLTDNGTTLTYSGTGGISSSGPVQAGTASGVGGTLDLPEGTAASGNTGHDICYADSTAHAVKCSNNNSSFFQQPQTVASGTSAMGTGAITSGTCATVVTTTATGAATTDNLIANPTADPTGVTGYAVAAGGSLYIQAFITSGNVNFKVCNPSSGSLTPAALTMQWRVIR